MTPTYSRPFAGAFFAIVLALYVTAAFMEPGERSEHVLRIAGVLFPYAYAAVGAAFAAAHWRARGGTE